ncbi:NADH dehydrogenase [Mycena floridula]|nr:NADH dehydrogenase [Mycena floridula]
MLVLQPLQLQKRVIHRLGKRAYHDLNKSRTGTAVVGSGPPGYSAVSGHVATVFGCTGFLGRYLVAKMAKMGTQVVVAYRDEDERRRLKLMGDLGQIVSLEFDLRNENQIAECVKHSDIVFNLVGRDHETKNFSYFDVHASGAERIAKVTAQCGVPRFVHVSHLNADPSSKSEFYKSKAQGEELVKRAFDGPTIIRPAAMFGHEDKLLNSMAVYPFLWKFNHAQTKTRPVHVMDVAQALANLVHLPPVAKTLALPGPSTLTYEYLLDLVSSLIYKDVSSAPVIPQFAALLTAKIVQAIWFPLLSPDEVLRRYIDDATTPGDWADVGVSPTEIEQSAITYIRRYRSGADFGRPVVFPGRPEVVEISE